MWCTLQRMNLCSMFVRAFDWCQAGAAARHHAVCLYVRPADDRAHPLQESE